MKVKPGESLIHHAFLAYRDVEDISLGDGDYRDVWFWCVNGYTPRLGRRPRLRRLAPLLRRIHATRAFWRWIG